MIFVTQDLNSIEPYNSNTLSLYSRCGIGDLLILRDYVMPHNQSSSLTKCEHCGSLIGSDETPAFRDGKKYLHIRLLKPSLDQRSSQIPGYLHSIVVPFLRQIFPANANIFVSLALNPNRPMGGLFTGDQLYFSGFAGTNDVLASQIFPNLPQQNLADEIFKSVNVTADEAAVLKTKYICIHTRYRSLSAPDPEFFRSFLFDVIGSSNHKVCLVGEKEDSCDFHSIYRFCKDLIPAGSLVDLTTNSFTINNLIKDCLISKYSKLCIAFGIGGNVVMNSYAKVPTHTYVDLGEEHPFFCPKNPTNIYKNKYSFMLKIGQILQSL